MRKLFIHTMLLIASASSFGAAKVKSEGPNDIIEKAYNLSLQKDRAQAVNLLVSAIKRESPTSPAGKELKTTIQEIGGLFYGEKAQQQYELALALRKTDLGQAQAKLTEALRVEPDNIQLLSESGRLLILKNDCGAASETIAKQRKWDPFDEQLLLVAAQAAVCQGDWPSYAALRSQADLHGPFAKTWLALEVERAYREKADARGREAMTALKKVDPEHPEILFWSWKLESNKVQQRAFAQRYAASCKNLSAGLFRRYITETFLCRRTAEAETFVESGGT